MPTNQRNNSPTFGPQHFFKAVEISSQRSRSILLLMIFTALLVLMALTNSLETKYNWYRSKAEKFNDILKYLVLPSDSDYANPNNVNSISEYIIQNEKFYFKSEYAKNISKVNLKEMDIKYSTINYIKLRSATFAPVLLFPENFEKRLEKYDEIGGAINNVKNYCITEKEFVKNAVSKYEEALVEHLELIRVPILGISFHVNYLGIYSGAVLLSLYLILYFSLFREKTNIKMTFHQSNRKQKGNHYYTYEYASMSQVLSLPKKLFVADNKRRNTYDLFAFSSMFFPCLIYTFLFIYDSYSVKYGFWSNTIMTLGTVLVDLIFFILIWVFFFRVQKMWLSISKIFDDHAFALNVEYIFEAAGEDKEIELLGFTDRMIELRDKNSIIDLWSSELKKMQKINSEKDAKKMLDTYIQKALERDFADNIKTEDNIKQWNVFKEWFYKTGRNHGDFSFLSEFTIMLRNQQKVT